MFVLVTTKYSGVKVGQTYRVLDQGKDYKKISVKGKAFYAPSYVFSGELEIEDNNETAE